jgi:ribonucleoside-diphosphate reductase alpha chain
MNKYCRGKVNLTPQARTILEKRYLQTDNSGRVIETPEDMFRRVSRHVAQAEKQQDSLLAECQEKFYDMMARLEFLPNSPCLMNAGTEVGSLAACYVLPVEDSLNGIFTTLKQAMLISKSGGGTGFSFSRIRPKNDVVGSTGGVASGPLSFLRVYNSATEEVKQGGRRRGANMGILMYNHPDILDFIRAKEQPGNAGKL